MDNQFLAQKIQKLRKQHGLSQELLAEESGLNLRTIQRIESGTSEPRGDTLKRLAAALNVTTDEIIDWSILKDKELLSNLNISSPSFLLFPLLGILVPLIIWVSRKDKVKDLHHTARQVLNFQISWTILLFSCFILALIYRNYQLEQLVLISPSMVKTPTFNYIIFGFLYGINFLSIIVNTIRLRSDKQVWYPLQFKFIT